jgi:hypothetical protein
MVTERRSVSETLNFMQNYEACVKKVKNFGIWKRFLFLPTGLLLINWAFAKVTLPSFILFGCSTIYTENSR